MGRMTVSVDEDLFRIVDVPKALEYKLYLRRIEVKHVELEPYAQAAIYLTCDKLILKVLLMRTV